MADNLALWNSVERTDPAQTKPITGKSYGGTSPKPHYLVHRATETFGPCGLGWGFSIEERIEDGAMIEAGFFERLHVAKVRVWYKWNGERGEVEHIGGTMLSGKRANGKIYTDEDAAKKSVTDALVKALSMIGFAGDIFMGRYDDSKYLSGIKAEIAAEERQASSPQPAVATSQSFAAPAIVAGLISEGGEAADRGTDALRVFWKRLNPNQQRSVGGEPQLRAWQTSAAEIDRIAQTEGVA